MVVSDLKMGGSTGLDVLKSAKTLHPECAVILMTAFGTVSTAVEAMKAGAFDYVQKPFEIEEMEVKIAKALEMRQMQHQIDYLRHAQGDIYEFDRIIGSSGALEKVLDVVRKIVNAHDGTIDVSSGPDVGTRFRVTLPVTNASGWFK